MKTWFTVTDLCAIMCDEHVLNSFNTYSNYVNCSIFLFKVLICYSYFSNLNLGIAKSSMS